MVRQRLAILWRFNNRPGFGMQMLWRPNGWFSILGNQYALGEETLGVPGRVRYHTDDSVEIKYYDRPEKFLDKMAFSLTGDAGCEHGGGVSCYGNSAKGPKQDFLGFMFYNRLWFDRDRYGLTLGGGKSTIPAVTWSCCRRSMELPPRREHHISPRILGDPFKAWDASATFDWMPSQYITFRWEFDHRAANVPYWTGQEELLRRAETTGLLVLWFASRVLERVMVRPRTRGIPT